MLSHTQNDYHSMHIHTSAFEMGLNASCSVANLSSYWDGGGSYQASLLKARHTTCELGGLLCMLDRLSKRDQNCYQQGDIKDGENCFAHGTCDVFPVKSDRLPAKLLHKHQAGPLSGLDGVRRPKQRQHQEQGEG